MIDRRPRWKLVIVLLAACSSSTSDAAPARPPMPVPALPPEDTKAEPPAAPAAPSAEPPPVAAPVEPSAAKARATQRATERASSKPVQRPAKPRPTRITTPPPASAPPEPQPSAPVAAPEPPPPPAAAAKPATRVFVPSSDHIKVDVPAGLQRWLDADTRMQPWLAKVMTVIEGCYSRERSGTPGASGTIAFRLTMHPNARPDADIQSLPPQLSGIVTCATGQLLRSRMPLFTGTEGETYTVRVRFVP